jgi:hypothetical protein
MSRFARDLQTGSGLDLLTPYTQYSELQAMQYTLHFTLTHALGFSVYH